MTQHSFGPAPELSLANFRNQSQVVACRRRLRLRQRGYTPDRQPMTRRYNLGTALLFLTAVFSACGGDSTAPPPPPTTLELNIVTTGDDIDADGLLLTVDGGIAREIPANGILSITTLPGSHTLAISGVAFNCDVTAAPASADVMLATTTRVDVRASCSPYLRNTIIFTSEQFGVPEVMVMRTDGSRRERLTNDQQSYSLPVVSPDGQSIAVASFLGGSWNGIYLLDRFGKGRTKLVGRSTFDGSPAWSFDGTKLAFRSILPGPFGEYGRIFIVNRDGTGLRQLTPETTDYTFDDSPSWSPDGARLVFSRSGNLFLINADGTGLISTGVSGEDPAWSPDGTQIAYQSLGGGTEGIFAMDGTFNRRRLTMPVQGDSHPRWSPDGSQLVFQRLESGIFQLYKMSADGTGGTRLSTQPKHDSQASWSPSF